MVATLIAVSKLALVSDVVWSADEELDMEFFEFLGQLTEAEELGVDVDKMLDSKEQDSKDDEQEQSE